MGNNNRNIKMLINDLNERKKELDCLFEINRILKYTEAPLDEVFNDIIREISLGWQFPEICKVQILYDGKSYKSEGLKFTELKQNAKIKVEDAEIGEIQVYYIKPVRTDKKPIFLYEEQKLLNTIAENISQYITLRRFKDLLQSKENISDKLNIPVGLGKWLSEMHLSESEIKKVVTTKINFKKGESIFKQGTFASYIVIQTKGLTRAFVEDINERSFTFKIIKPYDIIGLSSLFGDGRYGFSAATLTPAEGYLIEKTTMIDIIESNIKFNFELLKWYSTNFKLVFTKMDFLANKQALGRIANTLIYLSNNIFNERIIDNSISRRNIAELSGMSTENAVRILSELKSDGIIKISKNGIEIIHHDLLMTFSIAG